MTSLFKNLSALFAPAADKGGGGGGKPSRQERRADKSGAYERFQGIQARLAAEKKSKQEWKRIVADLTAMVCQDNYPPAMLELGRLYAKGAPGCEKDGARGLKMILDAGVKKYIPAYDYLIEKADEIVLEAREKSSQLEKTQGFRNAWNLYYRVSEAGYPFGSLKLADLALHAFGKVPLASQYIDLAISQYKEKYIGAVSFNHDLYKEARDEMQALLCAAQQQCRSAKRAEL